MLISLIIVGFFGHEGMCSSTPSLDPTKCSNICECNNSLDICNISACNYTHCIVSWYGICLWGDEKYEIHNP